MWCMQLEQHTTSSGSGNSLFTGWGVGDILLGSRLVAWSQAASHHLRAGESLPPARGVSHSPALYVRGGMNPIGAAIMFAGVLAFLRGSHFAGWLLFTGWLLFIFGGILWVLLPARTPSRTR